MGDSYGTVKVAAVQAASVFLDREGSTAKACRLIREAGRNGARVIGFPEGFIPAHPVRYHHHTATGAISNKLAVELFKNAVAIPGPETIALGEAARKAIAYVVMGVCEKLPNTTGTMFNTQIYFGPDGRIIRKHQKIMPTVGERLVHMGGYGDTFGAFDSDFGPMSGLICGENLDLGIQMKLRHDFAGHYNRPDIFQVHINRAAPQLYRVHNDPAALAAAGNAELPSPPRSLSPPGEDAAE